MSIFTVLYHLFIGPLELLFEVIFSFANRVVTNPGLAIVFLSLAVNFLVLPLYDRADAMQEESRKTEDRLAPVISHIKKCFRGDERFMILQAYYRENHYKPTDALKGSMSLLLEIPFFMAAYNFLSGLELLQGVSFGPIADLGAPDTLLVIGGVSIHMLPILMTVVNLISGAIYTKGFSLKSKIQLYGMALLFLVLLYDSPSGLAFYWTLNNVFSLAKNIVLKLKNPRKSVSILASIAGIAGLVYFLVRPMPTVRSQVLAIGATVLLQLPLILCAVQQKHGARKPVEADKTDKIIFFGGCTFLTLLLGVLIPSALIHSSPEEFISSVTFESPLMLVLSAAAVAAGLFLVWFGIFYMLAGGRVKKIMGLAVWIASGVAVVDYMFFGTDYGSISNTLKFDFYPEFLLRDQLVNLAVVAVLALVMTVIWKKKAELVKIVNLTLILAVAVMSGVNIVGIQQVAPEAIARLQATALDVPRITLSRTGKNVVVIMMDRAVNAYVPYILREKPELQEQFAGFTYYPNIISHGGHTNFGAPGFYGGYEYVPEEMNRRTDRLLVEKHNEALKVMPVMFLNEGYDVTVCDPAYANYRWIPDVSIYNDYPEIHAYNTKGKFDEHSKEMAAVYEELSHRNFFCYSVFKTAPMVLQPTLYAQGVYNQPDAMFKSSDQTVLSPHQAVGLRNNFMQAYGALQKLPELVEIQQDKPGSFVMFTNDTTHDPMLLQEPQYEPAQVVDNREYDEAHADRFRLDGRELEMVSEGQYMGYQNNMAAMIQLGRFMDYLRANDLYDNTRIIIGSDHGYEMSSLTDLEYNGRDLMPYHPLLLVKDFGSTEFTMDTRFMTNADVPTLAADGVIADPVNPFTGKPIDSAAKQQEQHIILSREFRTNVNNGPAFLPSQWLGVHDSIFDSANWSEWTPDF